MTPGIWPHNYVRCQNPTVRPAPYTQHRDLMRKHRYLARYAPREDWERPSTIHCLVMNQPLPARSIVQDLVGFNDEVNVSLLHRVRSKL